MLDLCNIGRGLPGLPRTTGSKGPSGISGGAEGSSSSGGSGGAGNANPVDSYRPGPREDGSHNATLPDFGTAFGR